MNDPAVIRGLAVFVPIAGLALSFSLRRPGHRDIAAVILATAWNLLALALVNTLALRLGWWTFTAEGAVVAGIPVDLLLGWALLWGAIPAHTTLNLPVPLTAAAFAWIDLGFMPLAAPVVTLGPDWLYGEAAAITASLIPGLLLARWTVRDVRLRLRVALQVILAGGLAVALPAALAGLWSRPAWALSLAAQAFAVPALLGLAAVREFAVSGHGTPLPYDPPKRLVTGGPYGFVRNPMQVSMTLGFLALAPLDIRFLAAAVSGVAYGAGLAAWHENDQLRTMYGTAWDTYRARTRPWIPRLRPHDGIPPATVYIARTCPQCHPGPRGRPAATPSTSPSCPPKAIPPACAASPTPAPTASTPKASPPSPISPATCTSAGPCSAGCSCSPASTTSPGSASPPSALRPDFPKATRLHGEAAMPSIRENRIGNRPLMGGAVHSGGRDGVKERREFIQGLYEFGEETNRFHGCQIALSWPSRIR
ncbi:Protein-S-isoprenylcysteine O-methyltransferase Ste14 [Sinosporangium album]|uniref:Protein-S-isoprenylcysteine O-methyltransferase Ste14 n=1 Tax=Sinosporangium album TaxID=504805 RepID=A0A1G8FEF6_9ACTN|nr:isoprenylcysteine carboxylmethyltransferase family protein [Sinosporangium album]SDH80389.1 Protein-S-isoprenylcysteine O-methyltransferase Ste14 [Sinosporangium album]